MSRLSAIAIFALFSQAAFATNFFENGYDLTVPPNVTTISGDYREYEAENNLDVESRLEYLSGSSGVLAAGNRIHLKGESVIPGQSVSLPFYNGTHPAFVDSSHPKFLGYNRKMGFMAHDGASVWGFIDSNFNGISDYIEELDADGDGLFDALEDALGTSNTQGAHGFEIDVNGDGVFDKLTNAAHGGTTSQFIPGVINGYLNEPGYGGNMSAFYQINGTYYSLSVGYGDPGFVNFLFPSISEWFNFYFTVTYTYFDFEGWTQGLEFFAESGVDYSVQAYYPGLGWQTITEIAGVGQDEPVYYGKYENGVAVPFDFLWELPLFLRVVELGKASIQPNGTFGDIVSFEGLGEVANGSLSLEIPDTIGVPNGSSLAGWEDIWNHDGIAGILGDIEPWDIDLDGDGIGDFTIDPINKSGKIGVPIGGQTIEIELNTDGGVWVSLGKYKIGKTSGGRIGIGIPGSVAGTDGQFRFSLRNSNGCDDFQWSSVDVNGDGIQDEVAEFVQNEGNDQDIGDRAVVPVVEDDGNGGTLMNKVHTALEVQIDACNAVQIQYRMPNTSTWKNLGGLHLNRIEACRLIQEDLNSELLGVSSLYDIRFRMVRYTADINFDSGGIVARNETFQHGVNYKPTVHSDPNKNVNLSLLLKLSGGAVFDSNNSDELVIQGAGQINYDIKAGNVGSFEISASLAYRETVASPLEVSFGECSDESFSTVGLKIEKIKGLYGPDSGNNFKKDSYGVYQLGYKSDYGFGRVYANRAPTVGTADSNSDGIDDDPANADADGNPKYDKGDTYVDITVDTEMTFSSAPPQSQVRVVWSFEDPDDDSDNKMPSQSQTKIDPNGSAGDDNYNKSLSAVTWGNITTAPASYGVSMFNSGSGSGYTKKFAYSGVDEKGRSMVRMKLSQAGGDNYKVKVALEINEQDAGIEDETGEFAVWKLVHLEVDKADGVDPKGKLNKLNNSYRESFVHFEIQPTTTGGQPQGLTDGKRYIDGASGATNYRSANFDELNKEGWYYLASAKYYNEYNWDQSYSVAQFMPIFGKVEMIANNKIRFVDTRPPEVDWNTVAGKKLAIFQSTSLSGPSIQLNVADNVPTVQITDPNDPTKLINTWELTLGSAVYSFVEDDASNKTYFDLADHGFSIGQSLKVVLVARAYPATKPNGLATQGLNPSGNWDGKFNGAAFLFENHSPETIVHELAHCLGMAHRCGNPSHRSSNKSCVMQYSNDWLRDPATSTLPPPSILLQNWSAKTVDSRFCVDHILAIRRADLPVTANSRHLGW